MPDERVYLDHTVLVALAVRTPARYRRRRGVLFVTSRFSYQWARALLAASPDRASRLEALLFGPRALVFPAAEPARGGVVGLMVEGVESDRMPVEAKAAFVAACGFGCSLLVTLRPGRYGPVAAGPACRAVPRVVRPRRAFALLDKGRQA